MRILLLSVVMFAWFGLSGQSTLKIFVASDDERSDMEIIDLNTSSLMRYNQAVDSTNIRSYSTTMSTQVIRMKYEELYPGDKEDGELVHNAEMPIEEDIPEQFQAATKIDESAQGANIVEFKDQVTDQGLDDIPQVKIEQPPLKRSNIIHSKTSVPRFAGSTSKLSKKAKIKYHRKSKGKKYKRYKNHCPKFF